MTVLAALAILVGFFTILWPLIILLGKKQVLRCQWIYLFSQVTIAAALFLYATFYIPSLNREYVLCFMFTIISMFCAPMYYLFIVSLTSMEGVTKRHRRVFIVPLAYSLSILTLGLLLHAPGYKLFLTNVYHHGDYSFIEGYTAYNLMVLVGYYGFLALMFVSILTVSIAAAVMAVRHHRTLKEYYASYALLQRRNNIIITLVSCIIVFCTVVLFGIRISSRPPQIQMAILASLASVMELILGYYAYNITYSAEELGLDILKNDSKNVADAVKHAQVNLKQRIAEVVENEQYYMKPDANVLTLAERLHVPSQAIIDTLHQAYNCSFSNYVNGFRISSATDMILSQTDSQDTVKNTSSRIKETLFVEKIYKASGFSNKADFKQSFNDVMRVSFKHWMHQR